MATPTVLLSPHTFLTLMHEMNTDANNNAINDKKVQAIPPPGYVQVRDDDYVSGSASVVRLQRSLIDSALARACSLQRVRGGDGGRKEGAIKRAGGGAAKFGYKNRTPNGSGGLKRSGSCLKIAGPGSNSPPLTSLADVRPQEEISPHDFITKVLLADADETDSRPSKALKPLHADEFLPITDEQIAAYSNNTITAVRNNDVEALRRIHESGQTLQCRNRFGESLLHTACRRAAPAVVAFLLNEAGVSPRIRDDYGRTPLHDACWRGQPSPQIVESLLKVEPRLALVKDARGFVPFAYARREHWGSWREFLSRRRDLFRKGEGETSQGAATDMASEPASS